MNRAFLLAAAFYTLGQSINLLFQLLMLERFGMAGYGQFGLAQLVLLSILFMADLGYATLFLRIPPGAPGWAARWSQALGHRLLLTLLLDALAVAGWLLAYGRDDPALPYLLAVLPATLFGLASFSSPLIAAGRQAAGFAAQQIAWPVALLCWWLLGSGGAASGLQAGLCVSLGYLLQALVGHRLLGLPGLLQPRWGGDRKLLEAAWRLSAMGIAGTLHDRLTPFLVGALAPAFLPAYLLLSQVLHGAAGLLAQANRLLVAEARQTHGPAWCARLEGLLLLLTVLVSFLLLGAAWVDGFPLPPAWLALLQPVWLNWGLVAISGLLSALLIGRQREREVLRIVMTGLAASALLQLLAAAGGSAEATLWARLACAVAVLLACLRVAGQRPGMAAWFLGAAALLAALAGSSRSLWLAGIAALLLATGLLAARDGLFGTPQPREAVE